MRITTDKAMRTVRSGQVLYRIVVHVNVNRFTTPHTENIVAYPDPQYFKGKRKHVPSRFSTENYDYPTFLFNGNWAPSWFTSRRQAQRFCDEVLNGLHPAIINYSRERDFDMDMMDEGMGICDRGLGYYEDPLEREYDE